MNPKAILFFIPIFFIGIAASAQYTEKINTNRPGTSQGAFSVGNNVLQLEGGIGFGKEKHVKLRTKTNSYKVDYSVRYGLLIEQLELRLNGRYRLDAITNTFGAAEEKINQNDFEINTLGAKYLIFDPYKKEIEDSIPNYEELKSWKERYRFKWKYLVPAFSAYAGVNFITKNNPFTHPDDKSISPKVVLMTQNNWNTHKSGNWVLVTNLIIDKIATSDMIIGWIITSTHTLNEKWAAFAELQGQKSDFYSDDILRFGGAYLMNKNFQIDANFAFNFKDTPSLFTVSAGASYRFDWHKKDEIIGESGVKKEKKDDDDDDDVEGDEDGLIENDSLKLDNTPFVNEFEDDSLRVGIDQKLDDRRTEERIERERIADEKLSKKEGKKSKKEERRRLKREAKEARKDAKAKQKTEKEKEKMLGDIDEELDKMEKEKGLDKELEDIDKQIKDLEKGSDSKDKTEKKKKDSTSKSEAKKKKEDEKRRKAAEKRMSKERKRLMKEEKRKQKLNEKVKKNTKKVDDVLDGFK